MMESEREFYPDDDDMEVVMDYADHYDECPLFNYSAWLIGEGVSGAYEKATQVYTDRAILSVSHSLRRIKESK